MYLAAIQNFEFIPLVLKNLKSFTPLAAKVAIESLNALLVNSPKNLQIISKHKDWQSYLIRFLTYENTTFEEDMDPKLRHSNA